MNLVKSDLVYDYYTNPLSGNTQDGNCYMSYSQQGVTPPSLNWYDNDIDCCLLLGTVAQPIGPAINRWAGVGYCCGPSTESWVKTTNPKRICCGGGIYSDPDFAQCACELSGGTWTGAGGAGSEYRCCDSGTIDGNSDNFIVRATIISPDLTISPGTNYEVVWGGSTLYSGGAVGGVTQGTCKNGVWTAGVGMICDTNNDCPGDSCYLDNWRDYSCGADKRCAMTHACSTANGCAACCSNSDCAGGTTYASTGYRVCDFWTGDTRASDFNNYRSVHDWCPSNTYNVKVTSGTCTDDCWYCRYFCRQSYNPGVCVDDLDGTYRNKCSTSTQIACASDTQCSYYPDITTGADCVTKDLSIDYTTKTAVQQKWCEGWSGDWYYCNRRTYSCSSGGYNCVTTCTATCDKTCSSWADCDWVNSYICRNGYCTKCTSEHLADCCYGTAWNDFLACVNYNWGSRQTYPCSCTTTCTCYEAQRCRDIIIYKDANAGIDAKYTKVIADYATITQTQYNNAISPRHIITTLDPGYI